MLPPPPATGGGKAALPATSDATCSWRLMGLRACALDAGPGDLVTLAGTSTAAERGGVHGRGRAACSSARVSQRKRARTVPHAASCCCVVCCCREVCSITRRPRLLPQLRGSGDGGVNQTAAAATKPTPCKAAAGATAAAAAQPPACHWAVVPPVGQQQVQQLVRMVCVISACVVPTRNQQNRKLCAAPAVHGPLPQQQGCGSIT